MERAAQSRPAILVDLVPDVDVRGDHIHFTHADGAHFAMPIVTCRATHRQITMALVEYDTRPCAKVFKFKKRKRGH